jgi:hypothetical protein
MRRRLEDCHDNGTSEQHDPAYHDHEFGDVGGADLL